MLLTLYFCYAVAMHFQVDPENSKPTRSMVDITVVVGRITVVEANDAPHVIPLAVPASVNLNSTRSPSTGVPERFVVMEVMSVPRPVKFMMSTLSVLVVGVAPGAFVVVSLRVTLLLDSVFVELIDGMTTPSTANTPPADRESVVSDALPSSIVVNWGAVREVRMAVPPTVGMFVDSISVNHPLVTLAPVAAMEPVIVMLCAPSATVPLNVWVPVKVFAASVLAIVADVVGNVYVCPAVPV